MSSICRKVRVTGRVQGVGFRWRTVEAARAIGVAGWVRNCMDGSVEVWVEGDEAPVEELLAWLRHGPPWARVDKCVVREERAEGSDSFVVLRSPQP